MNQYERELLTRTVKKQNKLIEILITEFQRQTKVDLSINELKKLIK